MQPHMSAAETIRTDQIARSVGGTEYHASTLATLLKSPAAKKASIYPNEAALLTPAGDFLVVFNEAAALNSFKVKHQTLTAARYSLFRQSPIL
jgi:hypothetical protein